MRDVSHESLLARLLEARLCTAGDVQRARKLVRRMTRDLPAFDSVWIDALAQVQALTPFQARLLEDNPPESLRAGDFVLQNQLGERTYLAIGPDRRRVVLKKISLPSDQTTAIALRLELLLERARNVSGSQLAVPSQLVQQPAAVFLASRFVPGHDLQELLIRRGRFPADVVLHIADHLLAALATWHAAGLTHGDLRLTKLRLSPEGRIVLVDAGVQPAVSPELMVHTVQSPELAETVAPERIGTNQPATAASDLYAAGCILWHLLAGRTPHPPADPLAKLAAHQTKRIPDVREFAPDTPPALAELVLQLTSSQPDDRPRSAEAARRRLGMRGLPRTRKLARFRRQFDAAVPLLAARPALSGRGWTPVVIAVVLLGAVAVGLSDRGMRTQLLSIAARAQDRGGAAPQLTQESAELLAIPAADARGVITLTEAGPYAATEISAVGPLVVQAAPQIRPRIVIEGDAWKISAQQISLKNLDIDGGEFSADASLDSLLSLQCQRVQISGCRFSGPRGRVPSASELHCAAVRWAAADRRDPQAGTFQVESSTFMGEMQSLTCVTAPRRIVWRNVLKSGAGAAVAVQQSLPSVDLKLTLDRVTLRNSGPILTCAGPLAEESSAAGIEIAASACVLEVMPPAALVELIGPKYRPDWAEAIRLLGDGSLIRPGTTLLAANDPQAETASPLESDDLQFEGLFIDDFEFAGGDGGSVADSELAKTHAPRRQEDSMPGVAVNRLPR